MKKLISVQEKSFFASGTKIQKNDGHSSALKNSLINQDGYYYYYFYIHAGGSCNDLR